VSLFDNSCFIEKVCEDSAKSAFSRVIDLFGFYAMTIYIKKNIRRSHRF